MKGVGWTPAEDVRLIELDMSGASSAAIGAAMPGRTVRACVQRRVVLRRLGRLARCKGRRRQDRTEHKIEAVLSLLRQIAEEGGPCPSSREMAAMIGYSHTPVQRALAALVARGRIRIVRASAVRRRIIVCGGPSTDWTDVRKCDSADEIPDVPERIMHEAGIRFTDSPRAVQANRIGRAPRPETWVASRWSGA